MTNLIKYAKICEKVLAVIRIIIIVMAAVSEVALIVAIYLGRTIVDAINQHPTTMMTINSGGMTFHAPISAVPLPVSGIRWFFVVIMVLLAAIVLLGLRLIRLLRDLMIGMQEGRPFSDSSTSKVRQIGWWAIVFGIVAPFVSMAIYWFMFGSPNPVINVAGTSTQISFGYNINAVAIVIGIMMLLLSLVFDYGAKLQQQSDETL